MIHTFTTEEHSWLSNMAHCQISLKERIFPSVEHAYISEKRGDDAWRDFCSNTDLSAKAIKKEGSKVKLRPDWDKFKILVMEYCLREKFKHEPFRSKLKNTGKENLQEGNYWGDTFWGVDLKQNPNVGENHLGRLLMKIRDEI